MSRLRFPLALAAGLIVAALAGPASAQGTACLAPNDPACNHLKCYQIFDKPSTIVQTTPVVQLDNQFGREVVFRLQPVMLCVPTLKSCCNTTGCSPSNCRPDPVPAPALPHFKCYRIKAKTCVNADCTTKLAAFPKGTSVNLLDQFGPETNVPLGKPLMLCTPAEKIVVGQTTTTTILQTTTTTSSTTTTTLGCHLDPALGCTGPCPPTMPPGSQCEQLPDGTCGCVAPPVCCECPGVTPPCFNTNGPCPSSCTTAPNSTCNAAGQCACGFCSDAGACSNIPCSTSQPCPAGTVCDPNHCPAPCDPCNQGGTACQPIPCLRPDGTTSQCQPNPVTPCSCCGPPGGFCSSNTDCCSGMCDAATQTCK
jgi:hypothetical protein